MTLADLAAAAMLLSLVAYCLLAGADFGGGVWDLLAFGPRAEAQRRLADEAIAPVWEANHVWLILIVVLLFSCFPPAFAAASVALHVPQVPVAHSYGNATPARNPACSTRSPGRASNS